MRNSKELLKNYAKEYLMTYTLIHNESIFIHLNVCNKDFTTQYYIANNFRRLRIFGVYSLKTI